MMLDQAREILMEVVEDFVKDQYVFITSLDVKTESEILVERFKQELK